MGVLGDLVEIGVNPDYSEVQIQVSKLRDAMFRFLFLIVCRFVIPGGRRMRKALVRLCVEDSV